MPQFTPRGDRSLKLAAVDLVVKAEPGELLTYAYLATALNAGEFSGDPRDVIRGAISAARPLLIRDHGRAIIAERGKGYRVALPGELAGVAQEHRGKADRQVSKALAIVTHGDTSTMTQEEFTRFQATRAIIVNLHRRMNNMEERMARIEEAIFGKAPAQATGEVISTEVPRAESQRPYWAKLPSGDNQQSEA